MGWTVTPGSSCTAELAPPCNLVHQGWNATISYADASYNYTIQQLDAMYNMVDFSNLTIPEVTVDVDLPDVSIDSPVLPTAPDAPTDLEVTVPTEPTLRTLLDVPDLAVSDAPQFLAEFPTINLPAKPGPADYTSPGDAPSVVAPTMPDVPDYSIPDVPTLTELNLPSVPVIALPEFVQAQPEWDHPDPDASINWSEELYSSAVLTELQEKLITDMREGNGGLPDAVVTQIWEQNREREHREYNRVAQQAVDEFAARGYDMPPGALAKSLREATRDNADRAVQASREAAIEQAKRAYENLQFVIQQNIGLEGQLITYAGFLAQRAFDAQRATADIALEVHKAKINVFQAETQAYSTYAQVFQTRVQAELSKLEAFRAELEGQKLVGDINLQDLEAYKSALQGVQSIVDIYKTEVDAKTAEINAQKLYLDTYATEVQAYATRVQARATEYEGYAREVDAELAQVRLFESAASAYNSEVNGYRALVDAESAKVQSKVAINQAYLQEYESKLRAFSVKLEAEVRQVTSRIQAYEANIAGYNAEVSGAVAKTDADRANAEAIIQLNTSEAELRIRKATAEIDRALGLLDTYRNILTSGASVAQTLTASAFSAVSLSAGISGSDSTVTSL